MASWIKNAAIPLGGYLYQNLIGIEFLCNWLDNPHAYKWMKFEADDKDSKALDDVYILASDNSLQLYQVKFVVTDDVEKSTLSWEWLLTHKPRGTSLIHKWSKALFNTTQFPISVAALITNRRPDRTFESTFTKFGTLVDFDAIPEEIRLRTIKQIGTEALAREFFERFEFRHSHKEFGALEQSIVDRLISGHAPREGFYVLFHESLRWALQRDCPTSDGKITIESLRRTLAARRPQPINQEFYVPETYVCPDEGFSRDFVESIIQNKQPVTILWGSPGQGKSTFLSHLANRLAECQIPSIRHHYFLHVSDTADRMAYNIAANSLILQMEERHMLVEDSPNCDSEHLREWITICGARYKSDGKPFVVIIDGLDHVWRENARDRAPLDNLFSQLLPVPENVCLLVGTQKVADTQLPRLFSAFVREMDWIKLPQFSLVATKLWLERQLALSRFALPEKDAESSATHMTLLAEKFHELSVGHPLHLTFSFEAAVSRQQFLSVTDLERLEPCPQGDIALYYSRLWSHLTHAARDALHLVAHCTFRWPSFGLEHCLKQTHVQLNEEIGHLFYDCEIGILPLHNSLSAFVRDTTEHAERVKYLRPAVIEWLRTQAPEFLRWGWLWLMEAQHGDFSNLVDSPSRQWIRDGLSKAYPNSQIESILAHAEKAAIGSKLLPQAVRLRCLKERLQIGRDYQLASYRPVLRFAIWLADDEMPLLSLYSEINVLPVEDLEMLARAFIELNRVSEARKCREVIAKKLHDRIQAHAYTRDSLASMSESYLRLCAKLKALDVHNAHAFLSGFMFDQEELYQRYFTELSQHGDLRLLTELIDDSLTPVIRQDLELSIVRLAGRSGASIHLWPEFLSLQYHPIVSVWAALYSPDLPRDVKFDLEPPNTRLGLSLGSRDVKIERYLHQLFFYTLSHSLSLRGADPCLKVEAQSEEEWFDTAISLTIELAVKIAGRLGSNRAVDFSLPYRALESVTPPTRHWERSTYFVFTKALLQITEDLFLATALVHGQEHVSDEQWNYVKNSRHFVSQTWLCRYAKFGYEYVRPDTLASMINDEIRGVSASVSEFSGRVEHYVRLLELAHLLGLKEVGRELFERVLNCLMGYGWHKDATVYIALNAIKAVKNCDVDLARSLLFKICPLVDAIGEYTDGDDVSHARVIMAELLFELSPDSYASYFGHLLECEEWYTSDELFAHTVRCMALESPVSDLVLGGVWNGHHISLLRERSEAGEAEAGRFLAQNERLWGYDAGVLKTTERYTTKESHEVPDIDVRQYAPGDIDRLVHYLNTLHDYTVERDILHKWLNYWKETDQAINLLRCIEPRLNDDRIPTQVTELLDELFDLSLKLEGKRKAYPWIVAAQVHNSGWYSYFGEPNPQHRFDKVASLYRSDWEKFILDSTKPRFRQSHEYVLVPRDRLVMYLLTVNEYSLAKQVAIELIDSYISDLSEQPIPASGWLSNSRATLRDSLLRIGLFRLKTPIPLVKLAIINKTADLLLDNNHSSAIWNAFIEFISQLKLESEIVEALCIPYLARSSAVIDLAQLQRAVARPSILSNYLLGEIAGAPLVFNSWTSANSGTWSGLCCSRETIEELVKGTLIPRFFGVNLANLEEDSGFPFLNQWGFEFEQLSNSVGTHDEPHFDCFKHGLDRDRLVGQFVGKGGHLARSAYLRTLSAANRWWEMPEQDACSEGMYLLPLELSFLRMQPGELPAWLKQIEHTSPTSPVDYQKLVLSIRETADTSHTDSDILHLSFRLNSTDRYMADIEMIPCLHLGRVPNAEDVFLFSNNWLGKAQFPRSKSGLLELTVDKMPVLVETSPGEGWTPILVPFVGEIVGYLNPDSFERVIQLPIFHSSAGSVVAIPQKGGMAIVENEKQWGRVRYWNRNWTPTHDQALGANCGVQLSMSKSYLTHLIEVTGMQVSYHWKARILTREQNYGAWEFHAHFGSF